MSRTAAGAIALAALVAGCGGDDEPKTADSAQEIRAPDVEPTASSSPGSFCETP